MNTSTLLNAFELAVLGMVEATDSDVRGEELGALLRLWRRRNRQRAKFHNALIARIAQLERRESESASALLAIATERDTLRDALAREVKTNNTGGTKQPASP